MNGLGNNIKRHGGDDTHPHTNTTDNNRTTAEADNDNVAETESAPVPSERAAESSVEVRAALSSEPVVAELLAGVVADDNCDGVVVGGVATDDNFDGVVVVDNDWLVCC